MTSDRINQNIWRVIENNEVKVTWRIPSEILKELKHKAIDDNVTVTELAIQALKDYLRKSKK